MCGVPMRLVIVGAGPVGLYFSILMKRLARAHDIVVFERDAAGETFGWGVAFGHPMLDTLRRTDPPTYEALIHRATTWDRIAICHRNDRVEIRSEPFAGLARVALIDALRARAAAAGVTLHFQTPVRDVRALPDADLIVGADGAHSLVRRTGADTFEPRLRSGHNQYAWFAVNHRLDALTLAFRRTSAGVFAMHAYPIDAQHSNVIVECSEPTWSRAGLDRRTDPEACAYLSDAFETELGGHLVHPGGHLRWRRFLLVENARWRAGRLVLIGDALHTVHFSTGAGTQLAIDDAVALAGALGAHKDVDEALDAFEAARRPAAEAGRLQAEASLGWFECLERLMSLSPVDLAFRAITETRRIDADRLGELDPAFAARIRPPSS